MQELTDPDGNSQGSLPSPYSVEWVWSDGVAAHWDPGWLTHTDGLLGSSWTTNAGTFDINSPTSNYAASTTYRGNFAYSYAVNDRISFRVRGLAPGGNCNTYQAVLYSPSGATLATYNAASADGTFYPTTTGVYRVELAYSGATGVIPASGLVTYYIPVGVSPTTIAAQPGPAAQAVTRGATVTYAVSATGTNLTYQWRKHGLPIAGATAATLARTNVQTVDAGIYSVTVAGANGTVTSSGATLTVNPPAPSITSALTATVAPGATFAYVITGNESPTTFGATGLPPGLTVNIATGAIGGTCSQLGTYSVTLSAANVTGAGTATLTLVVSTLADSVAPTVATGLNYAEKTATTITLVWRAGTDNIGIVRYEVYRGTTSIGSTSDLVFADGGLTANGTYVYKVVAFDAANNSSPDSALLTVTTTQDSSLDTNQDGIPNAVETALGIGTGSGAGPETPTTKTNQVIHRPKT